MPFASDEGVIARELLAEGLEYDEAAEEPQLDRAGCFRLGMGIWTAEEEESAKLVRETFRSVAVKFPRYSGVQKGVHGVVLEHE